MKYLIVGAGGTGGCIGAYMALAGKDVTLIARGKHLENIKNNGLMMDTTAKGIFTVHPKIFTSDEYSDKPDVIFVCVKGYSIDGIVPFFKKISDSHTIIIPILNIYGTGEKLQNKIPSSLVTDGCIYVSSGITEPGKIKMYGDIFRVVFGVREKDEFTPVLEEVKSDLEDSGITAVLSDNIRRDALRKFSYVSSQASCGLYYNVKAGEIQKNPEIRKTFSSLVHEIDLLSRAMGIDFGEDIVKVNLSILDNLSEDASTSMQRDIENGRQSEIDGLLFEVVEKAHKYNVQLPVYEKISAEMREKYGDKR